MDTWTKLFGFRLRFELVCSSHQAVRDMLSTTGVDCSPLQLGALSSEAMESSAEVHEKSSSLTDSEQKEGDTALKSAQEEPVEDSGSEEGGGESDAEEEFKREEMLRQKLDAAREKYGNAHEFTVKRVLRLVSLQTTLHSLSRRNALLVYRHT